MNAKLSIYDPEIKISDIYFRHPGAKPYFGYTHDVDIVKFKGKFIAGWNANKEKYEDVPGQYNFYSTSTDFENWSTPAEAIPYDDDNQWQPNFINYHDNKLFCAWCTFTGRKVFIADSEDGVTWNNQEVELAPPSLLGKVAGFPTNHGLLTRKNVMLFPCSLPMTNAERCIVGDTKYAGILRSEDGGKSWHWSEAVEAMRWSEMGESPDFPGGDSVSIWEPMLYELPDGTIGMLIRNSSSQDQPERRPYDKPHHMLLYSESRDQGKTWTRARPVELDTIISRNFAVSGKTSEDSLLMVMNDWHTNLPEPIARDRYFLSLFVAPVADPDLLLPGPVIQPPTGWAFYPNGFVDGGKLYLAYTYPVGIQTSLVESLPDFSKPFLLPRGRRPGIEIFGDEMRIGHRHSGMGLVLTKTLTRAETVDLSFEFEIRRYDGSSLTLLTLGGKTRGGTALRAVYGPEKKDLLQIKTGKDGWSTVGEMQFRKKNSVKVRMGRKDFSISIGGSPEKRFATPLLRKIFFGGLYEKPVWPIDNEMTCEVRYDLSKIRVG